MAKHQLPNVTLWYDILHRYWFIMLSNSNQRDCKCWALVFTAFSRRAVVDMLSQNCFNPLWLPCRCSPDLYNGYVQLKNIIIQLKSESLLMIYIKVPSKRLGSQASFSVDLKSPRYFIQKTLAKKKYVSEINGLTPNPSKTSLYTPRFFLKNVFSLLGHSIWEQGAPFKSFFQTKKNTHTGDTDFLDLSG